MNPWSSIWLNPRETIQHIIDTNPHHQFWLLVLAGGLGQTISNASSATMGEFVTIPQLLAVIILAGPISGVFSVFVQSWVLLWVLRRFGAVANLTHIRTAVAWSWAPLVYTLPLWGVKYILFKDNLFILEKTFAEGSFYSGLWGVFNFIDFLIVMWTFFILVNGIIQVAKIPMLKGIGAVILSGLLITIPALIIVSLCSPMMP